MFWPTYCKQKSILGEGGVSSLVYKIKKLWTLQKPNWVMLGNLFSRPAKHIKISTTGILIEKNLSWKNQKFIKILTKRDKSVFPWSGKLNYLGIGKNKTMHSLSMTKALILKQENNNLINIPIPGTLELGI